MNCGDKSIKICISARQKTHERMIRAKYKKYFRSLFLIGMLIAGVSLQAAEVSASETAIVATMSLSMTQAVEIALEQSPEVQESILNVVKNQADQRIARSAMNPRLDTTVFQRRESFNIDTFMGEPTPGGARIIGPFNWGEFGVSAKVPLFDTTILNRWKAAKYNTASAREKIRITREYMCALVVGQYLQILRATESVKAAESRVKLAETLYQLAEDQLKNNVGTKIDCLRAGVKLENEKQALIRFRSELKIGGFGLIKLLSLPPGTQIELSEVLEKPDLEKTDFAAACKEAFELRPELASLKQRQKSAQSLKKAARGERLPSLNLSGSYGKAGLAREAYVPIGNVALTLEFPLEDGGKISAGIKKADAELKRLEEERRSLEAQICLEIQVAQTEIETSISEVDVASKACMLAEEELVQAQHRFEAGISDNIDLTNAQDELSSATNNRIAALYHLNQARVDLVKAIGKLEPLFTRKEDIQ